MIGLLTGNIHVNVAAGSPKPPFIHHVTLVAANLNKEGNELWRRVVTPLVQKTLEAR